MAAAAATARVAPRGGSAALQAVRGCASLRSSGGLPVGSAAPRPEAPCSGPRPPTAWSAAPAAPQASRPLACSRTPRRPPTATLGGPLARSRRRFSDFAVKGHGEAPADGRLRLAFAAACLPHPDKVAKGGEDAYFANPARRAFGVADGVGGWAESGVDPGEYSRCLLRFCHEGIVRAGSAEGPADLHEALLGAARRLQETQIQGGTTALLGQLNGSIMSILNLGDSGAILLRPALRTPQGTDQALLFPRVVFRSSDQTHYFNCPYQLGSSSGPIEAPDFIRIRVRTGDLIVAATDGVFDNLFDHQVQAIVARHLGNAWRTGASVEPQLQGLATSIVKQAQRIGQQEDQKDVVTPFALAAHSEGISFLRGGKLDDTTAVVGLVCGATPGHADKGECTDELPPIHNFIR